MLTVRDVHFFFMPPFLFHFSVELMRSRSISNSKLIPVPSTRYLTAEKYRSPVLTTSVTALAALVPGLRAMHKKFATVVEFAFI